jgi:hypothetical protein
MGIATPKSRFGGGDYSLRKCIRFGALKTPQDYKSSGEMLFLL